MRAAQPIAFLHFFTSPVVSGTQGLHFPSVCHVGINGDSKSVGTEDCVHSIKISRWAIRNFVGPSGIGIHINSLKYIQLKNDSGQGAEVDWTRSSN